MPLRPLGLTQIIQGIPWMQVNTAQPDGFICVSYQGSCKCSYVEHCRLGNTKLNMKKKSFCSVRQLFWLKAKRKWDRNMSKKGEDVHIIISEMISLNVSHSLWAYSKLNARVQINCLCAVIILPQNGFYQNHYLMAAKFWLKLAQLATTHSHSVSWKLKWPTSIFLPHPRLPHWHYS